MRANVPSLCCFAQNFILSKDDTRKSHHGSSVNEVTTNRIKVGFFSSALLSHVSQDQNQADKKREQTSMVSAVLCPEDQFVFKPTALLSLSEPAFSSNSLDG